MPTCARTWGSGCCRSKCCSRDCFGATVPDKLAYRYAQLFKERREGLDRVVPRGDIRPERRADAKALARLLRCKNRDAFVRPERRTIRYATFDAAAMGDRAEPTDEEIAARYERDAEQYAAAETRDVTQLIVPTKKPPNRSATALPVARRSNRSPARRACALRPWSMSFREGFASHRHPRSPQPISPPIAAR